MNMSSVTKRVIFLTIDDFQFILNTLTKTLEQFSFLLVVNKYDKIQYTEFETPVLIELSWNWTVICTSGLITW